jgi:hypothetical protein
LIADFCNGAIRDCRDVKQSSPAVEEYSYFIQYFECKEDECPRFSDEHDDGLYCRRIRDKKLLYKLEIEGQTLPFVPPYVPGGTDGRYPCNENLTRKLHNVRFRILSSPTAAWHFRVTLLLRKR